MSDFLPPNYAIPSKGSNYMKFEDGENRFRILDKAIIGYEYWVTKVVEGKEVRSPKRLRMNESVPVGEIEAEGDLKHFWAMPVYNYNLNKIQILEVTQKGIQASILALTRNKKYGSPENYTLAVTRTGEKMETRYQLLPEPKDDEEEKQLVEIKKQYKAMNINLEALYSGDDPFANAKVDSEEDNSSIVEDAINAGL